ncbi:MAG TPA: 3-dehydro-L-gulonate 2-dehydrogenase [Pyrinomonadaceae bacterium]|jgi:3-dehydro-L-gulonate 2-dehydrogenase
MLRVTYAELYEALLRVLLKLGMESERARLCARLFAETSLDGVYSHGLNRFPRFVEMIRRGVIDLHAEAVRVSAGGAIERWDGRLGPGNLNAYRSMQRAIELSREFGLGCVALRNTNHWMRGGSYGWQAASAGAVGICWTNTMPNLPPWGATDPRIGNNPLVIAVPRPPRHVVLDTAMSQFSYGALASYRMRGERLPVVGGFDKEGRLTRDPAAIEESGRPLPIGFWKGSGLALMLDMLAALLSGGRATHEIQADPDLEVGLSQVFLAFNVSSPDEEETFARPVDRIIEHLQMASAEDEKVRYPGERTLETRRLNLERGIPVEPEIWRHVQGL